MRTGRHTCDAHDVRVLGWAVPLTSYLYQQVREALTTSALLQLPRSMSRCAKEDRVQAVLEELVRSYLL